MIDLTRREQLAAQIVAITRTDFHRPGPDELRDILKCAEAQIKVITSPSPDALPSSGA
jgi:hypothetical protein